MKHIKKFNEDFNWSKLNIFSNKEKEKREEFNEYDESLANAIYSEIKDKVKPGPLGYVEDATHRLGGLEIKIENNTIRSHSNALYINGKKLDCSKKTKIKFWNLLNPINFHYIGK